MNRFRSLLPLAALAFITLPAVAAAQEGPFLTRSGDSQVAVKREGRRSWQVVAQSRRSLLEGDSIRVGPGSRARLCLRDGTCTVLTQGTHQVRRSSGAGQRGDNGDNALVRSVRTLGRLFLQQPTETIRTTIPFVARSDQFAQPAELLLPADSSVFVLNQPVRMLWLPATGPAADSLVRFRLTCERGQEGCGSDRPMVDTLVAGSRIDLDVVAEGVRYCAELVDRSGTLLDRGCFYVADDASRSRVRGWTEELRRDLEYNPGGTAPDEPLFLCALLLDSGFWYDALLLLDSQLIEAPGDPALIELWGAILTHSPLFRNRGD
jgi:hypothetical protein